MLSLRRLLPLLALHVATLLAPAVVTAQVRPATATLAGVIVDEAGRGIAGAGVGVHADDPLVARDLTRPLARGVTDRTGAFRLEGVPAGAIVLVVEHPRYKPVEAAADLPAGVTITLRITLVGGVPPTAAAGTVPATAPWLRGVVTDTAGRPVADAEVAFVDDSATARTDSAGRFELQGIAATTGVLRARRLGYRATYVTRRLDDTSAATLVLQPLGAQLAAVRVRAERDARWLEELRRRQLLFGGVQVLRDEIERRGAYRITDLLQGRAGLEVRRGGFGNGVVFGRRSCRMHLFLNGVQVRSESIDDLVNAIDVVAIEAYNSAENTPAEFRGLVTDTGGASGAVRAGGAAGATTTAGIGSAGGFGGGDCGSVVVWTR